MVEISKGVFKLSANNVDKILNINSVYIVAVVNSYIVNSIVVINDKYTAIVLHRIKNTVVIKIISNNI
jgi:hypothetical protein